MLKKLFSVFIAGLTVISLTACGSSDDNKKEEAMSGNKWSTEEGTLLDLDDNRSFKWYNDKKEKSDGYYSGTYEIYTGNEAVDYLAGLGEEYGITVESQEKVIKNYTDNKDNYYCLVLNNEECIMDGENTLEESFSSPYYGFYSESDKSIELFSLKSFTYYTFNKA